MPYAAKLATWVEMPSWLELRSFVDVTCADQQASVLVDITSVLGYLVCFVGQLVSSSSGRAALSRVQFRRHDRDCLYDALPDRITVLLIITKRCLILQVRGSVKFQARA